MRFTGRSAANQDRRRQRSRRLSIETLEGRELLTAAPAIPVTQPAPLSPQQQAVAVAVTNEATAANNAVTPKVINGSTEAATDAWNGYWLVHSMNVAKLGLNYAKLVVSHNTRKVGAAYLDALVKGDTKTLQQLGNTPAVKSVGNAFSQLSSSPGVKYVGDQFSDFGKKVVSQWDKIFGGGSKPTPPAPAATASTASKSG